MPSDPKCYKLALFRYEGEEVDVSIQPKKRRRSLGQNDYLWGVVYQIIVDETGLSVDEVHDAMRIKFLRVSKNNIMTILSTSGLTTIEFDKYVENIRQFGREFLNLYIPLPNEIPNF